MDPSQFNTVPSQQPGSQKRKAEGGDPAATGCDDGDSYASLNEEQKKALIRRIKDRDGARERRNKKKMDPNFRPRKKQNKKNLMPSDFEGPPVAGPSNAITRVAPDPAPTIPLESPDLPNMTAGLWSGALYHMPHNFTPRSVDEIPIDPSLRMNEPSISPAPIPRRDPYVFMERPSVHGPPLAPPAPPAPTPSNTGVHSDAFQYLNLPPTSSPAAPHHAPQYRPEATLQVDAGVQTAAASTTDRGVEALPDLPTLAEPLQGIDPKDLTHVEGFAFPEHAEIVEWADGHRTYLPWFSDPKAPNKNILKDDANHVRTLSKIARPTTESDYIAHLDYTAFKSEIQLVERIHEELSCGNPVILRGYPSRPVEPNLDSLDEVLGLKPYRVFEAIDSVKRAQNPGSHPHIKTTLADFCKGLGSGRVQCILDCATLDGATPTFVKHLDQGHTAWPQLFHRFQDRHYVPVDVLQSKSWILAHTPLVHTYPHHDAEGSNTWTLIGSGDKIWIFLRPYILDRCRNRKEFSDKVKPYLDCSTTVGFDAEKYPDGYRCFFFCAKTGDIVIQPPGTHHEVYTPTPSVTWGGHFLTNNTMHLTEVARAYDAKNKGRLTNQEHASSQATISIMMASLQFMSKPLICKTAFAAWCNMVLHPSAYSRQYFIPPLPEEPTSESSEARKTKPPAMSIHIKRAPQPNTPKDIIQAADMARKAVARFKLPTAVFHHPSKKKDHSDFIFDPKPDGKGWMDPGPMLEVGDFFEQFREEL